MRLGAMLKGWLKWLGALCLMQGLAGCMANALYERVTEHPYKESYEFNGDWARVLRFEDSSVLPLELSYRVRTSEGNKAIERFALVPMQMDFASGQLVVGKPVRAGEAPEVDQPEACPRVIMAPARGSRQADQLELVQFSDLARYLAPCRSGYMIYAPYSATDGKYRLAVFRVVDSVIVMRRLVDVPAQVVVKDGGNLAINTGAIILMPVALAADIVLFNPFELMFVAARDDSGSSPSLR